MFQFLNLHNVFYSLGCILEFTIDVCVIIYISVVILNLIMNVVFKYVIPIISYFGGKGEQMNIKKSAHEINK